MGLCSVHHYITDFIEANQTGRLNDIQRCIDRLDERTLSQWLVAMIKFVLIKINGDKGIGQGYNVCMSCIKPWI